MEYESLIQRAEYPQCFVCDRTDGPIEVHHIFFGPNRKISDKYKCVVYLCKDHHTGTYGVHGKYGHELDLDLKRRCQEAWEETYGDREKFIETFGRSYIWS